MAAVWTARQFHNPPEESHEHPFLVALWEAVGDDAAGRFDCRVYARNAGVAGSDPAVLEMLVAGEVEFFTQMGGILGQLAPVMEIQGLPFAFTSSEQVYRVMDGELGALLRKELAAKGIHCFARGLMENGFRQISTVERPIKTVDDLVGLKLRIPGGRMFADLFESLGAAPVVVTIAELYEALKTRRVHGQENPLVVTEVNRLYEVTRYVAITDHMWSGFNLLANGRFWRGLPPDVQAIIARDVATHVARQREYTRRLNRDLPSPPAAPQSRPRVAARGARARPHLGRRRKLPAPTRRRVLPALEDRARRDGVAAARSRGGATHLTASGLTGEPTAPVNGSGGATKRNS